MWHSPEHVFGMLAGKEIPGPSLIARLGLVIETKYRRALDSGNHAA